MGGKWAKGGNIKRAANGKGRELIDCEIEISLALEIT